MRTNALKALIQIPLGDFRLANFLFGKYNRQTCLPIGTETAFRQFFSKYARQRIDFGAAKIVDADLSGIQSSASTGNADDRNALLQAGLQQQDFGSDVVDGIDHEIGARCQKRVRG